MQIGDRYARFYPPLAVVLPLLSAFPPFHDVRFHGLVARYGTLYAMAGRNGGGPAQFGLMLLFALVALLVVATFVPNSGNLPIAITCLAALAVVMLVAKPGTGTPTPSLSATGATGLGLVIATALLGAAHAIHVAVDRRGA